MLHEGVLFLGMDWDELLDQILGTSHVSFPYGEVECYMYNRGYYNGRCPVAFIYGDDDEVGYDSAEEMLEKHVLPDGKRLFDVLQEI